MSSLKRKAIGGFFWDMGGVFSQHAVGFVISIFLARILSPEDFGIVGMALVFISISQIFTEFGFASSIIHNQHNTSVTYSSIFFINIFAGILLFLFFQMLAPAVGKFYDNEAVVQVVQWLSINFILNALSTVQIAILRKELKIKELTIRSSIAQVVSGVVGVYMALQGYGIYSLVVQNILGALLNTIILWKLSSWYPQLIFSWREVKKLLEFSSFVFLDRIFSGIFKRLDVLVIGKVFSASMLGFYSRAESINNLVAKYSSTSVSKVFFPVLSKLQNNEDEFLRIYYKVISVVSFVSFGLTGVLYILGEDIIIILFGQKWQPSAPIFELLILKAFSYPVNLMMVNAFLGKGKSKENFLLGIVRKVIALAPFIFAITHGIIVFLIVMVMVNYLVTIINMYFLKRMLQIPFWQHFFKIFGSSLVLFILLISFQFIKPELSLLSNVLLACAFSILHIFYNWSIGNDGLQIIFNNVYNVLKRNK